MTTIQKVGIGLVTMLLIFLAGFWTGKGQKEIEVQYQDRVVEKEVKGETQIVYKDRVVTVTKTVKPDGTTTETTRTEEKSKDETKTTEKTEVAKEESGNRTETPVSSNYSLGVSYVAVIRSYNDLLPGLSPSVSNIQITAGRRLLGDLWLDIGVAPVGGVYSLGVSFKF